MTALTPQMDPPRRRATDSQEPPVPLHGKLWNGLRAFLGSTVRMYIVLIGAVILLVLYLAVSASLQATDKRLREKDARDALIATYSANLRTYDLEVQARNECVTSVGRSDLNRGQHEATVEAFENLKVLFPESQGLAVVVDAITASLQAGPLLSQPPRSVNDCPSVPVAPTPPFPVESLPPDVSVPDTPPTVSTT